MYIIAVLGEEQDDISRLLSVFWTCFIYWTLMACGQCQHCEIGYVWLLQNSKKIEILLSGCAFVPLGLAVTTTPEIHTRFVSCFSEFVCITF